MVDLSILNYVAMLNCEGKMTDSEKKVFNAFKKAVNDLDELGIDPFAQIADCDDNHDLMDYLIEKMGWIKGWMLYYLITANE